MNKRIKELAKQAEQWAAKYTAVFTEGPDFNEMFKRRFAELIVQECLRALHDTDNESWNQSVADTLYEHFKAE